MQNPVVDILSGAICCKLWPQTILGPPPHMVPVMACFRRPDLVELAESRPTHFCVGRASPPPRQNLLDPKPQVWDSTQAKMPGSNARSRAWDRAVFSHVQGLLDPSKNAQVDQKCAMAQYRPIPWSHLGDPHWEFWSQWGFPMPGEDSRGDSPQVP